MTFSLPSPSYLLKLPNIEITANGIFVDISFTIMAFHTVRLAKPQNKIFLALFSLSTPGNMPGSRDVLKK